MQVYTDRARHLMLLFLRSTEQIVPRLLPSSTGRILILLFELLEPRLTNELASYFVHNQGSFGSHEIPP